MLIDLGEEREDPVELDRPQWATGWRPLAALIALVPALVLGAAAPAPRPALSLRADLELGPSEEMVDFSGKEILVRDGRVVTVYEPDGRERWHATLASVQDVFFRVDVDRGRVLAMAHRMQVPRTVAFDLANGAKIWEFEGWADTLDDMILVSSPEGGSYAIHDADTLGERWSVHGIVAHSIDVDGRALLALKRDGSITEYRLSTGDVIRSGRIDLPPGALNFGLGTAGGAIVIWFGEAIDGEPKMLSVDRVTYAPRAFLSPVFNQPERYDCGTVTCEASFDDGGQVSILDPSSGKKLWETRHGSGIVPTPAGLFAFPTFEATSSPPMELLDPRTGRRVASLEGWQPIMLDNRIRAAPLVLRQVHTTGSAGKTFIAGFDRMGLRVLGSVPSVTYNCRYADRMLACVSGDRRLLVVEIDSGSWQG